MRSGVCVTFFLILCTFSAYGAIYMGSYNDPKNPGKCTIRENVILSPGERIKDPNRDCGRIICGTNGTVIFHTCGVQLAQGCRVGDYKDKSLPYPQCCMRHVICE